MIGIRGLIVVALFTVALVSIASAQHPPEHQSLHEKFYSTWMRPDNRSLSCCSNQDCAPAQSKLVNGKWYARHSDNESWAEIPPEKIERDRDSPDGQSHLCQIISGGSPYPFCFLPAAGG